MGSSICLTLARIMLVNWDSFQDNHMGHIQYRYRIPCRKRDLSRALNSGRQARLQPCHALAVAMSLPSGWCDWQSLTAAPGPGRAAGPFWAVFRSRLAVGHAFAGGSGRGLQTWNLEVGQPQPQPNVILRSHHWQRGCKPKSSHASRLKPPVEQVTSPLPTPLRWAQELGVHSTDR
jgi:hypothetical protein